MKTLVKYAVLGGLLSCSQREDIVFSASDDLHLLILYREHNDFEMLYNGFNTVEGNYTLRHDTIWLTYRSEAYFDTEAGRKHPNDVLTRAIAIDRQRGSIRSVETERMLFCGEIGEDKLK
jgi:hypothetical protein